ncbi:hypothetical protein C1637_00835 [Chryseobacterium lactis]|uniref:Anti-sigma factor n=1 Tax=Chryseobacterium lactis TaxID=1241981 RepID=A0A3G6RPC8_CHRLC|nr:hypothetical protein [Chryseobacterium lactis]AZA81157.1 hypothetical protein EG342_04220 [Chryseobacterium lactis]AZB06158.1 hypothetical protein EG341_20345 [Chryseobacterium lactis]PNW15008.1 hypothetical protein C1637_00835 [Chryseobacterium lactis]
MNTSKDNLEFQIRKQMEEREIEPSRDLWSEIKLQKGNVNRTQTRVSWLLVASGLVLLLGLGSILFFSNENTETTPKMVKEVNKPKVQQSPLPSEHKEPSLVIQATQSDVVKNVSLQETIGNVNTPVVANKKSLLKEPVLENKPIAVPYLNPKIIAQADTLKMPVKNKKYVDPETLLFSVEHKDIIEKTKGKSNVATIDLNGK